MAEYIPWGWYGISSWFLKREMNIKIFKGFQSKYSKLLAYQILKLLLLIANKTVPFSSPFRTSFALQEDMFYKLSLYLLNQG
jgi:hypothetical protein